MKWRSGKTEGGGKIDDRRIKGRDAVARGMKHGLEKLGEAEVKIVKAAWEKIQPPTRYESVGSKILREQGSKVLGKRTEIKKKIPKR